MTAIPRERARGPNQRPRVEPQPLRSAMETWPGSPWPVQPTRAAAYGLPVAPAPRTGGPRLGSEWLVEQPTAERAAVAGDRSFSTRVLSGLVLFGLLGLVGKLALTGYYVFSDSFVAPLILSPDSDVVLPSKLNLARLQAERGTLLGRIDQASATLHAAEAGVEKLLELKQAVAAGLDFTQSVTSETVRSSTRDLSALSAQRRLIEQRVGQQEDHVRELERQLEVGLVRKADLERERDVLSQLRLGAIQNDRDRLASGVQHHSSFLAQRALATGKQNRALSTPEMVQQKEQLIRIDVDVLRMEAEQVSKRSELRTAQEELAKLDALVQQVKDRPVFRAIESRQNVAFVPYTQLEGMKRGAVVYDCAVWGILGCKKVGSVGEVLPGEVAAQDPWGAVARGQYALLSLQDASAAKAKVLRVRSKDALDFDLQGLLARVRR